MSGTLFRQEFALARREECLGSIRVAAALSRWCPTALAAGLAAAIALLAFDRHIRRETVAGQRMPNTGLLNGANRAGPIGSPTVLACSRPESLKPGRTMDADILMEKCSRLE